MIDIDGAIKRDNILQYLAYYSASKGLMVPTTPEQIFNQFVVYKQMIRKGEYSLLWLAEHVLMQWGVPPDPQPELDKNMIAVPGDVFDTLSRFYVEHAHGDLRSEKGPKAADKSTTATLDRPHPPGDEIIKRVEQSLDALRVALGHDVPRRKPRQSRTRKPKTDGQDSPESV